MGLPPHPCQGARPPRQAWSRCRRISPLPPYDALDLPRRLYPLLRHSYTYQCHLQCEIYPGGRAGHPWRPHHPKSLWVLVIRPCGDVLSDQRHSPRLHLLQLEGHGRPSVDLVPFG